jgi:hypothetical protein
MAFAWFPFCFPHQARNGAAIGGKREQGRVPECYWRPCPDPQLPVRVAVRVLAFAQDGSEEVAIRLGHTEKIGCPAIRPAE